MKTLTLNLPDSVDPDQIRWELARSLYEKGNLTLEQAASLAELAPTYFKIRFTKPEDASAGTRQELLKSAKPFDRKKFDELVEKLNIQDPWEELVAMLSK